MDQRPKQNDSSADCRKLIDYLEKIEVRFSELLKREGGMFLRNLIEQLISTPESAIMLLGKHFSNVVDPLLLDCFPGTWAAFLLWDNFNGKLRILHKYSLKDPNDYIDVKRYQFVRDFVDSPQFRENGFSEPMSDIIFTDKSSRKKVLVFSWQNPSHSPDEIDVIKSIHDVIKPVVIPFGKLGEAKWEHELEKIHQFLDDIPDQGDWTSVNRENCYDKLAKSISSLADKIVNEEGNGKKIFEAATKTISTEFGLHSAETTPSVQPGALCRALIWNRLFDKTWQHLYYVPANFLEGSAVSGVICALHAPLKPQEYIVLTEIVNRIFTLFHFGISQQQNEIYLQQNQYYRKQLHSFALRSACAAIMARNKSHIHGSHIEHGLRNKMDSFEKIVSERLSAQDDFYQNLREILTF